MVSITPSERFTSYAPVTPTTAFPVNFPIFDPDDVKLLLDGVDYPAITVSATFVAGVSTDAVINVVGGGLTGDVVVVGDREPRRTDQYQDGRPLRIEDHNYSLNRLTIESQEQARDTNRAFKVELGQTAGTVTVGAAGDSVVYDEDGNQIPGPALGSVPGLVQEAIDAAEAAEEAAAAAIAAAALVGFRTYFVVDQTSHKALDTTVIKSVHELATNSIWAWMLGDFSAQIALDTTGALYRKADAVLATVGVWVRSVSAIKISMFGTTQAALGIAHAFADDIVIDVPVTFNTTATLPRGKRYRFRDKGEFNDGGTAGVVITVRGQFDAGIWRNFPAATPQPNKIVNFTGVGSKLLGVMEVYPEWWGAVGNARSGVGTNDTPALQAAHDCCEAAVVTTSPTNSTGSDGNRPTIHLRAGAGYGLGTTWFLRPTAFFDLKVEGGGSVFGTRFEVLAAFSGTIAIQIMGQANTTLQIMHFDIGNFAIQFTAGVSNASVLVGLQIGTTGVNENIIGFASSSIHDIYIGGFTRCLGVRNCRLIVFDRISCWGGAQTNSSALFVDVTLDKFTGDLEFRQGCQFVAFSATNGHTVTIENRQTYVSGGNNQVAGICFNRCIFYLGDPSIVIYAELGGRIHDIAFLGYPQTDSQTDGHFDIVANGANTIIDAILLSQFWFYGNTNATPVVNVAPINTGKVFDVQIVDCRFSNFTSRCINIVNTSGEVNGVIIANNLFRNINSAAAIVINIAATNFNITNNMLRRDAGTAHIVAWFIVTVATSNYYIIVNNSAGGMATSGVLSDGAAGAQKTITPNLT